MLEEVLAQTQYEDLSGRIVLDGYSGSFLHDLGKRAGISPGHFVVGLRFYASEPGKVSETVSVSLLAVECAKVGADGNAIKAFADNNNAIPVVEFGIEVSFSELVALIKRCSVVIGDRLLNGKPMECKV